MLRSCFSPSPARVLLPSFDAKSHGDYRSSPSEATFEWNSRRQHVSFGSTCENFDERLISGRSSNKGRSPTPVNDLNNLKFSITHLSKTSHCLTRQSYKILINTRGCLPPVAERRIRRNSIFATPATGSGHPRPLHSN